MLLAASRRFVLAGSRVALTRARRRLQPAQQRDPSLVLRSRARPPAVRVVAQRGRTLASSRSGVQEWGGTSGSALARAPPGLPRRVEPREQVVDPPAAPRGELRRVGRRFVREWSRNW